MVEKRAACFFTSGYTEAGEMQGFLGRMNPNISFKQCLPNKPVKRKGEKTLIANGVSDKSLIDQVILILQKYQEYTKEYDYIIIEDDLDLRFKNKTNEEIEEYHKKQTDRIHKEADNQLPVIFLYASPEIEAWFIADWNRCFCNVYRDRTVIPDIERNGIDLFLERLKKEIDSLYEGQKSIELYGYDKEVYSKLSEELISFFDPEFIRVHLMKKGEDNPELYHQVCFSRKLYYSKKKHGSMMLRNADANEIANHCPFFFKEAYNKIRSL